MRPTLDPGFSEGSGGCVHQFFKRPGEVVLIGVPAGKGDLAHGLVVLMEEPSGLGDTERVDIFIKRYPDLLFE